MRKLGRKTRDEKGIGIAEVLIAAALGMAVIGALAWQMRSMASSSQTVSNLADITLIKQNLSTNIDCSATAAAISNIATCISGNALVEVKGKSSATIVSKNNSSPTRFANWTIRAECNTAGGVNIRVAKPNSGVTNPLTSTTDSDFQKEPSLKKALSWTSGIPSLLIASGTTLCNLNSASAAAPAVASGLSCIIVTSTVTTSSCPTGLCCRAICPSDRMVTGGGATGQNIYVTIADPSINGWCSNVENNTVNATNPAGCNAVCCKTL
jgi:hypothetical protein